MKKEIILKLMSLGFSRNQVCKTGNYGILVAAKKKIIQEPSDEKYSEKYFIICEYLGA